VTGGRAGSLGETALRLGLPARIERAGLEGRIDPGAVVGAKVAGAGIGALAAVVAAPVLPGRLGTAAVALFVIAGFLAPDAALERRGRRRRERVVAALPDALDMLAVGAGSGRSTAVLLDELAEADGGPFGEEIGAAVAEIECGVPVRVAVDRLRRRVAGRELGALAAALDRSRTYGSPLAAQLHEQATGLRRDARRGIEDRAARAAPKIQLVVALVLVPSVLLMILAAIVAHADALFGAL
jgi:tight adherence protein C